MRTERPNYKAGAVYDYTVAGTTADGAQIQIASGIYTTEDGKDNELILPTDNWNYTSIRIAVSRRGESGRQRHHHRIPGGKRVGEFAEAAPVPDYQTGTVLHKEGDEVRRTRWSMT